MGQFWWGFFVQSAVSWVRPRALVRPPAALLGKRWRLLILSATSIPTASHERNLGQWGHVLDRLDFVRRRHVDDLTHDLFDRAAAGAAVLEALRRPAIQPVSQFLDGLHVARFAARDMHSCDFA